MEKNLMLAAIQLIKVSAVVFAISALSFGVGFFRASSHAEAHAPSSQPNTDPNWSELVAQHGQNAYGDGSGGIFREQRC